MAIRVTGNIVISDTQAISNVTSINASGNANVGNLGTAQVLATANITAPQLISNVSTGTAPLVVSSTTVVANLNANALQGNTPSQTATANTIAQRNADGNITANFYIGNGSQLTGISAGFPLANGTSNINAPAVNGNINISVGGTANVLVTTSTGVNVAGTLNTTGNANTGNLGTATAVITTGNITTINSGLMQNGNSNVTITSNANVTINAVGGARITATSTGANVTGTLGVSGNANTGNLGTGTAVITTANITTINSTLLQQGSANILLVNNGNIRFNPGGSADEVVFTSTGANVNGYLTVTGNITGGIISNSTNVFSTAGSNYAIGFRQMPQNSQGGATYTLVLDDEGKSIYFTGTTTCTVTIPANASQAFPIGSIVSLINNNSGNLSVNSSATLQLANGNAANRTVLTKAMATCIKTASDTWYIIGTGVS